jgi:hypothetical protein
MRNEDFFNNQLLGRIAEDEKQEATATAEPVASTWSERLSGVLSFFALRPLAMTSALVLLFAITGLGIFWKPGQVTPAANQYYVQFDKVSVQNSDICAGSVDKAGATVLWVEGLDWIDGSESLMGEAGV